MAGNPGVLHPRVSYTFLAASVFLIGLYATSNSAPVGDICTAVLVLAAVVAGVVGIRRNRPGLVRPWVLMVTGASLWAVASFIRSAFGVNDGEIPLADIVSVVAYVLWFVALAQCLRSAGIRRDGSALDGLLVAIGTAMVGWVIIVLPSTQMERTNYQRFADVAIPVLDALLLYMVIRVGLSTRSKTATVMLTGIVAPILAGNLQWALDATGVLSFPVTTQIATYLFGFAFFGAFALHPSMRYLGRPSPNAQRPLGPARTAALSLALLIPLGAALIHPPQTVVQVVVVSAGAVAIAALVFGRTIRAVRESERFESRLRFQATHDALTGLPNRFWFVSHLDDRLAAAATDGTRLVVLLVDVDDFKHINDTWGHATGDQVIATTAERLRHKLPSGTAVARVGGDEFAIVCADAATDPLALAEQVRAMLEPSIPLEVSDIYLKATVGITVSGRNAALTTGQDLMREADTALSRAKEAGRDRALLFDVSMQARSRQRMETEVALRHALDDGQLLVHYQPVVNLSDGRWRSVEALVRWQHPERGLVPPLEFISVAEDTGLIVPLGEWVLQEATRHVRDWRRRFGVDWSVAVNMSAVQMRDHSIVETVQHAIAAGGVDPDTVWIELTESLMINQDDQALAILQGLRECGVHLVVDDFGTGYSSLSYLKRFPIDRVKIDRSFVMGLGEDAESSAIVRAIIGMAHALGIETVAEGIETEQQREHLLALGCTLGQGYFFARPMPPADVEAAVTRLRTGASRIASPAGARLP